MNFLFSLGSLCLAKTISNAYIELGNLDKAISTLKTLTKRFSKSEWAIDVSVQIAQCLRMQGKYFEAKKALDESPNQNDDYKNIFRGKKKWLNTQYGFDSTIFQGSKLNL